MDSRLRGNDRERPIDHGYRYTTILFTGHHPILAEVCLTKQVERDEVGQLMLFNTSVLEYNGLDRWNYINPLVMRSHAFQQALQTLQQDPQTT